MTAPAVAPTSSPTVPDVVHWTCECSPDIALCGENVTGQAWGHASADNPTCPLCDLVAADPCPRCGDVFDADAMTGTQP